MATTIEPSLDYLRLNPKQAYVVLGCEYNLWNGMQWNDIIVRLTIIDSQLVNLPWELKCKQIN